MQFSSKQMIMTQMTWCRPLVICKSTKMYVLNRTLYFSMSEVEIRDFEVKSNSGEAFSSQDRMWVRIVSKNVNCIHWWFYFLHYLAHLHIKLIYLLLTRNLTFLLLFLLVVGESCLDCVLCKHYMMKRK